jgi:hypothetical protein
MDQKAKKIDETEYVEVEEDENRAYYDLEAARASLEILDGIDPPLLGVDPGEIRALKVKIFQITRQCIELIHAEIITPGK